MRARIILPFVLLLAATACKKDVDVTDPKVAAAIGEINANFRQGYQTVLAEDGTRHFSVNAAVASAAMRKTLEKLGFTIVNSEGDYYLHVVAPAPLPLSDQDWQEVRRIDEPAFRNIAAKYLGIKGRLATLDPEGLNVIGIITILDAGNGVDISITMRTEEIKPQPPESILPRRDYPPPSAVRIGFTKIWKMFEEQSLPLAGMAQRT